MRDEAEFQTEIDRLLAIYIQETDESYLKPLSVKIYQAHAMYFVRWIKGYFKPGSQKREET